MPIDTNTPQSEAVKILVVDDSRLVRVSIKRVIQSEFTVLEAEDGEQGWEIFSANPDIRVVITDAGMPRLDGYGLIKRIRECHIPAINSVPIIMVTGAEAGETLVRDKALALGTTDFILKPFDKPRLLARVRAHAKHDITQQALDNTKAALSEQSTIDPLTKVNNKKYYCQRGAQELASAKRHEQELSFIAVSIDNFPNIANDCGIPVAKKILQWVAKNIKNTLRTEDTVARVDDNVFAILAPTASRMAAAVLCERIRKAVSDTPFTHDTLAINITVSMGMACLGKDSADNITEFMRLITSRAKQAQQKGGNQTCTQTKKTEPAVLRRPVNVSLDKVVDALNDEKTEILLADLDAATNKMIKLLTYCNQKLNWELDAEIEAIKSKMKVA